MRFSVIWVPPLARKELAWNMPARNRYHNPNSRFPDCQYRANPMESFGGVRRWSDASCLISGMGRATATIRALHGRRRLCKLPDGRTGLVSFAVVPATKDSSGLLNIAGQCLAAAVAGRMLRIYPPQRARRRQRRFSGNWRNHCGCRQPSCNVRYQTRPGCDSPQTAENWS